MALIKTTATALATCIVGAGLVLGGAQASHAADYESFEIGPGFSPNPVVGTGLSGGGRSVDQCGYVDSAEAPDHVLYVVEDIESLTLSVNAPEDVTLLLENADTGEVICIDDTEDSLLPSFSSYWPAGTYNVWIGDFVGPSSGNYRYELYIQED